MSVDGSVSSADLSTLFETLPVGVVYQDAAGLIVAMNPAAEAILGGTREELLARTSDAPRWQACREDGSPLPGAEHPSMVALRTAAPLRDFVMGVWNPRRGERRFLRVDAVPLFRSGETRPYQVYTSFRDETELREAEARFRSVVESSPMGIHLYRLEPDGRLIFLGANPAADAILGVPNGQFVGKEIVEAFPPLRATEVPERYREIAERGGRWRTEQIFYEDRQIRGAFEVHAFRYAPRHTAALFLDITERKRAEAAILESRARLAVVIEGAELGIFEWDVLNDVTVVDQRLATLLGYPLAELLGKGQRDWATLIHPDDLPAALAAIEGHLAGHAPFVHSEYRARRKNGEWVWLQLRGKVVEREPDGRPRRLIGVNMDITERKRAEAVILESRERLAVVIEGAELGVIEWDIVNDVTVVGERMAALFGYTVAETMGKGQPFWSSLVHPDDLPASLAAMQAHLAGQSPLMQTEYRARKKSGEWIWVQLRAKVVERAPDGRPLRLVGVHMDITARKRAEQERATLQLQLLQAQKLESLGVLAGGIAHDFNNLLCGILGSADLAMLDLPREHPVHESLEQIRESSQRATELCRQLLAYAGKGRFVVEPLDLSALVEGMAQLLAVSIKKKVVLRYHLERSLPAIEGDATQLRQVVLNLLVNSAEAIGERSGAITLTTGAMECDAEYLKTTYLDQDLAPGSYVFLEVADTGDGMDEETQQRLFDPFFTTKFTGRGLGLAATLGIVKGHHGTIKVYSELGQGTTIKILLPRSDRSAAQATNGLATPGWRGSGLVLLIDDEETVRSVGKRLLERLGFEVLLAADGRAGVERYQAVKDRVSLVLLDLTMPHLNGEEVFRELRRLRPDVRVILMSGYNEQEVTTRFVGKGLAGFLQKPLQLATLAELLRRTLEP